MTQYDIPLAAPDISDEDIAAVVAVLKTSRLSLGAKLEEFEQKFAAYTGAKHAIAVSSGTAALHLCVRALDIKEGDEVITSPFSFIASANCILFEKATPVFVDILPDTLCIDPVLIEAAITEKTKAIVAVDILGNLCDWDALRAIADKHNLALIEDSCEALGSSLNGKKAGTFGDCGTFAFYPNKQMTTGEGGVVVTDRDDIADAARSMRNQGRDDSGRFLHHERLGYNYRISDINCALGISQLSRIEEFIQKRDAVSEWYKEALAPLADHITPALSQDDVRTSWFVYVAHLNSKYTPQDRDALLERLKAKGIGCNNYFPAIHLQPLYTREFGFKKGDFPITEGVSDRTVALPFYNNISQKEVATVAEVLNDEFHNLP
ncbi:MAG: polysaccharide biosynthesis protein [Flammeovirgaceae bacterium]|nr:polysaccharide biosynthesis protein [Flammeovirgaceae bacterium]|tara:strand:- start:2452 stop:3585 length:1134 start_codon:yes stop_codon:yes gene_type:complete